MKIVYIKIKDPIEWTSPNLDYYEDDVEIFKLCVGRVAGILIHEDEEVITLGEITVASDNPELAAKEVRFPKFRYIMTIAKVNIVERQDFEIKETTVKEEN